MRLAAGNSLSPIESEDGDCFALIPMSNAISRMIALPADSGYEYILIEDVVSIYLSEIFPNREVLDFAPFRVTRSADISLDEDGDRDLLAETQVMLDRRLAGDCVRLEIERSAGPEIRNFLLSANNAALMRFMRSTDLWIYLHFLRSLRCPSSNILRMSLGPNTLRPTLISKPTCFR